MATTVFPANTAGIAYAGSWDIAYAGVAKAWLPFDGYCQADFTATGTALTMRWATSVTTGLVVKVSVDGGAFSTITLPGSADTYTDATLFTGLSDAAHTVTIRHDSGTVSAWYLDYASAFSVTGAAPAIAVTTGFGTVYPIVTISNGLGAIEGSWVGGVNNGGVFSSYKYDSLLSQSPDNVIRFQSNAASLKVWMYCNSKYLRLYQDGVADGGGLITMPSGGTMQWVTLATGLVGSHAYDLWMTTGDTQYLAGLMAVGGTITSGSFPRRGILAGLGDSIMAGHATNNDSSVSYMAKLGRAKNRALVNAGFNGSFLLPQSGNSATSAPIGLTNRYTDLLPNFLNASTPDYLIINIGVNDINTATPPGTAVFQAAYQNLLTRCRVIFPATKFLVVDILPTNTSATNAVANRSTYNALIAAAVTAVADPNTTYINTNGWLTTGDWFDSLHPNQTGMDKIFTNLSSYVTTWSPSGGGASIPPPPISSSTWNHVG